ncbi:hypothetical protein SEA_BOYLE_59 [Mycobacterium phage Boyle]|uniref:Uncharacterized protein n=2 Tax=Rosebushvirus rosebush TaxID=2006145 RepID=G3M4B7_9CAUD|nr:hypothetical protein ARBITER_58 [Mycobacterium phage Arbiter]AVR76554.1 hypothetical protein SEA_BOYLE_59 [Mycobacterium phage Boyle]
MIVLTQADLEQLPDGTLITWNRIQGDPTSKAVAFVNVEYDDQGDRVVWLSPGGWEPMTPERAGITYPCHVVVLGTLDAFLASGAVGLSPEAFTPDPVDPVISGGTYPRDVALQAAAQVYAGTGESDTTVLGTAQVYADWLTDTGPSPQEMLRELLAKGSTRCW